MSWHCLICGDSDNVTGLMFLYDIRGGIPLRYCLHLKCLVKVMKKSKLDMCEFEEDVLNLDNQVV